MTTTSLSPVAPAASAGLLADPADVLAAPGRYRVLTGDRPTGRLHLGHYFGTLRNRVLLQDAGVPTFVVVADYQVVTDREDTSSVAEDVHELVLDYLAAGIDPERSTVFVHSAVPELNQLFVPFLSLVTVPELRRNPTVKAEVADAGIERMSGLMLTYPIHQAADILAMRGTLVPVGRDQLPHLEATRVVARRFAERYPAPVPVLTEPQALLSGAPVLLGTDGRKMGKSRGNAVDLASTEDETADRLRRAVTDSERHITYDPDRRPGVSNLVLLAALCRGQSPYEIADELGASGSAALKSVVVEAVNEYFRPMRARRADLERDGAVVRDVLAAGAMRASKEASATLDRVNAAMGLV